MPTEFACAPVHPNHLDLGPLEPLDLTYLCVDGTAPVDSAAFAAGLESAGKTLKLRVANLLDFVGKAPKGQIALPSAPSMDVQSFGTDDMKTLPIEGIDAAGKKPKILLPQGLVKVGGKATFADPALGTSGYAASERNSDLMKVFLMAPGISDSDSDNAYLDMANGWNLATDILYLSGHGSVGGTVCGEEGVEGDPDHRGYMDFFDLFQLWGAQREYKARCPGQGLRHPYWVVIAACFNMTPGLGQMWLRVLLNQELPVRGILSYRTPAPLAQLAVPVSKKFGAALAQGKTMLQAWQSANDHNEKWAAIAFDYAQADTLKSLAEMRKSPASKPTAPGELHYSSEKDNWPVKIQTPTALFEVYRYVGASWNKVLITNIDYAEGADTPFTVDKTGYVSNESWETCKEPRSAERSAGGDPVFYPGHIYSLHLFPPFRAGFEQGFQAGDQLRLSLIHVRHHFDHAFSFADIFDVLLINGQTARLGENYTILPMSSDPSIPNLPGIASGARQQQQQNRRQNRILFDCPASDLVYDHEGQRRPRIKPARIALRYRVPPKNSEARLWFWFRVQVVRDGAALFSQDFDTFIITPWNHVDGHLPEAPPADAWGG